MKLHTLIINPKAGHLFNRWKFNKLKKNLIERIPCEIFYTQYKNNASEIASKQYKNGCRSFIIFGGDGTIFEVINGIYPEGFSDPPTIGIFPTGTGNSMIKDFNLDQKTSLNAIQNMKTTYLDINELVCKEKKYFSTNIISTGFVAQVGTFRNRYFSKFGSIGYIIAVLINLFSYKSKAFSITVDGKTIFQPWSFLSFNNTRFTGGNMMMAPHADPTDGKIATVLVQQQSPWKLLRAFPKIFSGEHTFFPFVEIMQAENIRFEEPVLQSIMIDGEMIKAEPSEVIVHKNALKIYT
ncbi:MAG: YegS/Rv2252/BmrU family lipid kinase [Bdellovibrionales bacterium]|nr:YegS/Rv2252/BmrU family lipid kinase [Bdellovibrionales bacterium]